MKETIIAKHIWITGAGSGIGKSLALAYAKAGNQVVITGRDKGKLDQVAAIHPDKITVLVWDVTDDQSAYAVQAALKVEQIVELQGMDASLFERKFRQIPVAFSPEDLRL